MNYDFSEFHPNCVNRGLIIAPDGLHIYCMDCGISANVEAISGKISPADACKVGKRGEINRIIEGAQSPNVNKGGFKP